MSWCFHFLGNSIHLCWSMCMSAHVLTYTFFCQKKDLRSSPFASLSSTSHPFSSSRGPRKKKEKRSLSFFFPRKWNFYFSLTVNMQSIAKWKQMECFVVDMQSSRTQPKEWVWRLIRFWARAHSFGQTQIPTLTPNLALWLCAAFLQIHCFISEISQTYRKNSWCNDTPDGLCASNYKKNQITIEETKQARKVFAQNKTFHFYSLPKQSAAAATTR